jgi:virulence factor Mce-like protein
MTIVRKIIPALVLAAIAAGLVYLLFFTGGGPKGERYTVELDNAFGLTEGADMRVAGVNVGKIRTLRVDKDTAHALVGVEVTRTDFGDLRKDATCSIEPQSLIGEYFMDCQPGTSKQKLKAGGRIPVDQTTGTIPPDLVASIMRMPQREQLRFILSELGAGFAARGPELNQVIQRAIPALRETDNVLKILADNRRTLVALNRDASQVLTTLAANKRDVRRFVSEARDTAQISAGRRAELAETIRRLPAFLRELRPTLRDLGTVADKQTPALRDLRASADDLTTLLNRMGPFTDAAEPAIDALGEASKLGTRAVEPARKTVATVRQTGETAKDPATNLRFVLEHIDDRNNAVEESPVSPGGRGFTGLEAFMRYPFVQAQALNLFDSRGYTLKLNALVNECSGYTNAETAKNNPERTKKCNAWLGPNQPGVTTPDPSPATAASRAERSERDGGDRRTERTKDEPRAEQQQPEQEQQQPQQPGAPAPTPQVPTPAAPTVPAVPGVPPIDVQKTLEDLLGGLTGKKPAPGQTQTQTQPQTPTTPEAAEGLLDFLLG